jgi:hypothetical protein
MKYKPLPLRYVWLTFRLEQFWFPLAFLALFSLVVGLFSDSIRSYDASRSFLGAVLPLMAGILSAYAVLDDHALELQFSAPRPAWLTMLERLGLILGVIAICAIVFQLFALVMGISLDSLGNIVIRQLAWLIPSLALMGLGSAFSFALANPTGGAMIVGLIWIFQVILRGWFMQDRIARYLFLFSGGIYPDDPSMRAGQIVLSLLAAVLFISAWQLFRRQERYI